MGNIRPSHILLILLHTVTWLLMIHLGFDITGVLESGWQMLVMGDRSIDEAVILIPTLVGLFYWNSNFLIPRYLNRKLWWKYLLFILISYLFVLYAGYYTIVCLFDNDYTAVFDDPMAFYDQSLYLHLIVVGISASLGLSKIAMKSLRQKEQAEQLQRETEMKFLNAQVIPHFLFNTLNGIYAQAIEEDAPKTTESVLQLSEIMRFPLKNISKQSILLTDEIRFVEHYIRLQKLRLGSEYPVSFEQQAIEDDCEIIPFTIIPIVENAFKYGVSQTAQLPISFQLTLDQGDLQFRSVNSLTHNDDIASFSIGIENLSRRLALRYGSRYSIVMDKIDETYHVTLKVTTKGLL